VSYQRDYILRMIEQLGQFLARALKLALRGNAAAARQEVDAAYRAVTGLGSEAAGRLTAEQMLDLLADHRRDPRLLHALAELLLADSSTRAEDDPARYGRARTALDFLLLTDHPDPALTTAVAERLEEYEPDDVTAAAVARLRRR
jgi:uncharacterized protein involved in copper resistance